MGRHRFHGSADRFDVLADFVGDRFGSAVQHIADVAGGQGMLSRALRKRHNYEAEVIDPRGWTLRGVASRAEEYDSSMAPYYDLVVGLHPDQATRAVMESAIVRPVIVVPCCNFWDSSRRLGRDALVEELAAFCDDNAIPWETETFAFAGPMNFGIVAGWPQSDAMGSGA